jgi:hypothetical protein
MPECNQCGRSYSYTEDHPGTNPDDLLGYVLCGPCIRARPTTEPQPVVNIEPSPGRSRHLTFGTTYGEDLISSSELYRTARILEDLGEPDPELDPEPRSTLTRVWVKGLLLQEEITGCLECPLSSAAEDEPMLCSHRGLAVNREIPEEHFIDRIAPPDWCPLRAEPLVLRVHNPLKEPEVERPTSWQRLSTDESDDA